MKFLKRFFKKHKTQKETNVNDTVENNYQDFTSLWQHWIESIHRIVPQENEYYNLTEGITQNAIELAGKLENHIVIPEALIDFYKVQNVKYNPVTSAFTFAVKGTGFSYDLIAFKYIRRNWQKIQDLYFDDVEQTLLDDYDKRITANNYANPKWIPFAESRDGDYLLYDTDPSHRGTYGQIILLENESWVREVVSPL